MGVWAENRKANYFYTLLYEYDYVEGTRLGGSFHENGKHVSPTKRLID